MAMYSLWKAASNEHHSERAGKVVNNDAYKQMGQFDTFEKARNAFLDALTNNKPGTKIKLIGTVPEPIQTKESELAALRRRIEELEKAS